MCHTRNQTNKKKYPPLNLHTAAIYVTVHNFLTLSQSLLLSLLYTVRCSEYMPGGDHTPSTEPPTLF